MSAANPGGDVVYIPGAPLPAGRKVTGGFAVNIGTTSTPVIDVTAPNGRVVVMQGVRSFGEGGMGMNNADRVLYVGNFYLDYYKSADGPFWAWPGGTTPVTVPSGVSAVLTGQKIEGNFVLEAILEAPTGQEADTTPEAMSYFTLRLDGHAVVTRAPIGFLGNAAGFGRMAVADQPFRGDFRMASLAVCIGGYGDAEVPSQVTDAQIANARAALKAEITA
jgi:hypothetical protein